MKSRSAFVVSLVLLLLVAAVAWFLWTAPPAAPANTVAITAPAKGTAPLPSTPAAPTFATPPATPALAQGTASLPPVPVPSAPVPARRGSTAPAMLPPPSTSPVATAPAANSPTNTASGATPLASGTTLKPLSVNVNGNITQVDFGSVPMTLDAPVILALPDGSTSTVTPTINAAGNLIISTVQILLGPDGTVQAKSTHTTTYDPPRMTGSYREHTPGFRTANAAEYIDYTFTVEL